MTFVSNRVWWLGALLVTLGCSDDDAPKNDSKNSGGAGAAGEVGETGDAGDTGEAGAPTSGGSNSGGGAGKAGSSTGGGGGSATAEACGPAASMNADGILTAYPDISVSVTPAADFKVTSFNFMVIDDGDERGPLLKFFAEVKNTSTKMHCQFLPNIALDGTEIVTLAYGPPKHLKIGTTVFTTVDECIDPGESVVLSGVQRGVTEADLKAASVLSIEPGPSNLESSEYVLATPPTIQDAEVAMSDDGYLLKGTAAYSTAIYNQGIRVYPRDSRKLIVDELLAFPGNLEEHAAGSTAPFETEATPCAFQEYELFQTWINQD